MTADFESSLYAAGLRPKRIIADGEWHRCPTESHPRSDNGAFKLFPGGRVGFYQDWAAHEAPIKWKASDDEPEPIKARLHQAEDRQRRIDAMKAARRHYQNGRPLGQQHPYLADKGLSLVGCRDLRQDLSGALVVPAFSRGWMVSVQRIFSDGQKQYWKDAPMRGAYFTIPRPGSTVTAIVEGLATGLAVFQCVRFASVVVAFDAGNLMPVVDAVRPAGSVVVCADNDHGTMERRGFNPGIEKATNAASLIDAGVAWPEGIEGTDWADAMREWGADGVRRIERLILAKARYSSVERQA